MKNKLIICLNGSTIQFEDIEKFQVSPDGVCTFNINSNTKLISGMLNEEEKSISAAKQIKFRADFFYIDNGWK